VDRVRGLALAHEDVAGLEHAAVSEAHEEHQRGRIEVREEGALRQRRADIFLIHPRLRLLRPG